MEFVEKNIRKCYLRQLFSLFFGVILSLRAGDGTHCKKRLVREKPPRRRRGMTPIEKNVIVTDENGVRYEATYPKRAALLVKNGRARFIDEKTICLARPPSNRKGKNMKSDDIRDRQQENGPEQVEPPAADAAETKAAPDAVAAACETESPRPSIAYVLSRIDRIMNDTAYLHEALDVLKAMAPTAGPGDLAGASRAEAVGNVVTAREETNRKLLELFQKMYDDLKPKKPSGDVRRINELAEALTGNINPVRAESIIARAAQQMFVKPGAEIVQNP